MLSGLLLPTDKQLLGKMLHFVKNEVREHIVVIGCLATALSNIKPLYCNV